MAWAMLSQRKAQPHLEWLYRGEQSAYGLAEGLAALGVTQSCQHIIAQGGQCHQLGKDLIEELGGLQGELLQKQSEQLGVFQIGPETACDGEQQGRARPGVQQGQQLVAAQGIA